MPRLKTLPPLLQELPPLVGGVPQDEAERSRIRAEENPLRLLYATTRWKDLRRALFKRDRWRCCKTGVLVTGRYPAPNSPVLDHIVKPRGDLKLFWDPENLQTVSKLYHDSVKQRIERSEG